MHRNVVCFSGVLSFVFVSLFGCSSSPKAPSIAVDPADVPAVDLSSSKRVTEGSETSWQHNPTDADRAYLASTEPIKAAWATLYVNGLGCPLCATNIDKQLERIAGVSWMYVDLGHGVVQMRLADSGERPSPKDFAESVADAGFTLIKVKTH